MSLTKEDLEAISDLIDAKFDEQDKRIDARFDEQEQKINARFDVVDKKFEEVDKRFDRQEQNFDKKLDDLKAEFKEMLTDNNMLIAEHVQRVVSESEERLTQQIKEIKTVTADNCFNIVSLKNKIS